MFIKILEYEMGMEDSNQPLPKRKEKVKIAISLDKKLYSRIIEIKEYSEASVSAIISYVLQGRGTLIELLEHYKKEGGTKKD